MEVKNCQMPNKIATDRNSKRAIKELGKLIVKCRENKLSQSKLAEKVGLPRSNMKYIEDGINAPTAQVYEKLVEVLSPDKKTQIKMDNLYMTIRKVPPPGICKTIIGNEKLVDALRLLDNCNLTDEQTTALAGLIESFSKDNLRSNCDE